MPEIKFVIVGSIVTCNESKNVLYSTGYIAVEGVKIVRKGSKEEYNELRKKNIWSSYKTIFLEKNQFLMPGLVDCHVHGPQFPNIGLGLDRPLLEWLEKYTFPLEKQYDNEEFASKVYDQVVKRLLKNGTTTACYFGTLHLNGTLQLVKSVLNYQQRALVGKVSMNVENPMGYYNDITKELFDSEEFVKKVQALQNPLVEPIITPRFAVSCNRELLTKLGDLAEKYDCRIQSHISENLGEIESVLENNKYAKSYAQVYDVTKILTKKCIMAHAVHLRDDEMKLLSSRGVSVAHCPASNTRLMSGLCPLKKLIDNNITVGLGTDVAGGDSASILDAMRRAMDVSSHLELISNQQSSITWKEAFYLATLGGAKALNLENKIGSLEVGKEFDALIVDAFQNGGQIDQYEYTVTTTEEDYIEQLLQRFIYLGDDRNIIKIFVRGNEISL